MITFRNIRLKLKSELITFKKKVQIEFRIYNLRKYSTKWFYNMPKLPFFITLASQGRSGTHFMRLAKPTVGVIEPKGEITLPSLATSS